MKQLHISSHETITHHQVMMFLRNGGNHGDVCFVHLYDICFNKHNQNIYRKTRRKLYNDVTDNMIAIILIFLGGIVHSYGMPSLYIYLVAIYLLMYSIAMIL